MTNAELDEEVETRDAEAEITKLAELGDVTYERRRKRAGTELGIPVVTLDKLVAKRRAKLEAEAEAAPLYEHWNVEPWDEPVDGSILLLTIIERIRRHIVMSGDQATAVALWILLTWVHDKAVVHSPLFLATSPEANSGKTTLLGIVGFLVRNSLCSVSITGPALFRSIEKWLPTFVIDEADDALVDNQDLKSVVNSGWTRGSSVIRCDPETLDPKPYSTFCPKALGMKGRKLPDTTLSRAIIIEMQRKRPSEQVADFDHVDDEGLAQLRAQCARWAQDNAKRVKEWEPQIPTGFHNRTRANWKAMLAIAEVCGWQEKASKAASVLERIKDQFGASIGIQLLSDIEDMFSDSVESMFSRAIVDRLVADPEKPWAEYRHGKPLTQKQLANLLNGFGVFSDTVHQGEVQAKGYKLEQLLPLFDRYLHGEGEKPTFEPYNRTSDCGTGTSDENRTVREDNPYGSKTANLSYSHAGSYGCTVRKGGNGGGVSEDGNIVATEDYLGPPDDDPTDLLDDYPDMPAFLDRTARS